MKKRNKKGVLPAWSVIIGFVLVIIIVLIAVIGAARTKDIIMDSLKWFVNC